MSFWSSLKEAIAGKEKDYTKINIKSAIFLLSVPMILEMIMESLFAVVDIFFVGKLGEAAIATVGFTESIIVIVYSVCMGIAMAATALIARRFGEKKYKSAGNITFQVIIIGIVFSVVFGILGIVYAKDLLSIMGADEKVLEIGTKYTQIIMGGNLAIMLLFLINGAFRGAGQAHLAMRSLWIGNGINIILCPIFIYGIGSFEGWGLEGAAWATNIGRFMGVLYQLYHLFNGKHKLKILRENIIIKWKVIVSILKVSAGGMGQFVIDSISWVILTRIIAEFGNTAVAGYTIAFRILIFSLMPAWGLASSATTLVGQNLGAQKTQRAVLSVKLVARYNAIFLSIITILYIAFGNTFAGLFTNNAEVQKIAAEGLRIVALGYVFFAIGMVMIQAFNGAGDTKTPMYINIIMLLLLEVPLAYLLAIVFTMGITGVFLAVAICHSLHALVAIWFFRKGKWKNVSI